MKQKYCLFIHFCLFLYVTGLVWEPFCFNLWVNLILIFLIDGLFQVTLCRLWSPVSSQHWAWELFRIWSFLQPGVCSPYVPCSWTYFYFIENSQNGPSATKEASHFGKYFWTHNRVLSLNIFSNDFFLFLQIMWVLHFVSFC